MALADDALLHAKAQLIDQIDQVARALPHISMSQLAHQVDEIRRIAHDWGLLPVEQLARGLEGAISLSDGSIMILPFLESMRDAAGCGRVDAAAAQSFLAVMSQRRYG